MIGLLGVLHAQLTAQTWTARTSATDNAWNSVTYGNGLFVAVATDAAGTTNRAMTSPDGITWTARTTTQNNWRDVTYGAWTATVNNKVLTANVATLTTAANHNFSVNQIVTVSGVDAVFNGTYTITAVTANTFSYAKTNANIATVAVNPTGTATAGLFVATASSTTTQYVMTSPDGVTWTDRAAINGDWNAVAYGNGVFTAVSTGGAVMTSPDGITWTTRTAAVANSWRGLTYGNGLYVAVSTGGTGNRVMTSPDGVTWTSRVSAADNNWYSVAYGTTTATVTNKSLTTNVATLTTSETHGLLVNDTITITGVDATFNGTYAITAVDATNKTFSYAKTAANVSSTAVTPTGKASRGLFVAVSATGTGNRVMTSPTGVTWTSRTSAADNDWYDVTHGDGRFIAVAQTGTGNRVMTSIDGVNWTTETSANDNNWRGAAYGNGTFVAVANSGTGNRAMTRTDNMFSGGNGRGESRIVTVADLLSNDVLFRGGNDDGHAAITLLATSLTDPWDDMENNRVVTWNRFNASVRTGVFTITGTPPTTLQGINRLALTTYAVTKSQGGTQGLLAAGIAKSNNSQLLIKGDFRSMRVGTAAGQACPATPASYNQLLWLDRDVLVANSTKCYTDKTLTTVFVGNGTDWYNIQNSTSNARAVKINSSGLVTEICSQ